MHLDFRDNFLFWQRYCGFFRNSIGNSSSLWKKNVSPFLFSLGNLTVSVGSDETKATISRFKKRAFYSSSKGPKARLIGCREKGYNFFLSLAFSFQHMADGHNGQKMVDIIIMLLPEWTKQQRYMYSCSPLSLSLSLSAGINCQWKWELWPKRCMERRRRALFFPSCHHFLTYGRKGKKGTLELSVKLDGDYKRAFHRF